MSQLQRLTPLSGESTDERHDREITQIMQEMNDQDSALSDVSGQIKKAATAVFTFAAGDYTVRPGFYNQFADKELVHGLGYIPITWAYIIIGGQTFQLPYNSYRTTDGVFEGKIDISPGPLSAGVVANFNTVTPAFTAYLYVASTPAQAVQVSS